MSAEQPRDRQVGEGASGENGKRLGVLLVCFQSLKGAAAARHLLDKQLTSRGIALLDAVVLRVDTKHRASVYDPRRVLQGTLTAALTWGVFGLVTGGLVGLAIWGVLGAVFGGLFAHMSEHRLSKQDLAHIGDRLPADSSALVSFAEVEDPRSLLEASKDLGSTVASVAVIGGDLSARVFAGAEARVELPNDPAGSAQLASRATAVSMVLVRYPSPGAAKQVAMRVAAESTKMTNPFEVELVIRIDGDGRRHVADPNKGVGAWAKSDTISWGGFGLVVGALVGVVGGGGFWGLVYEGLVTGIGWALFGLVAGALYGLWAGRAVSARRLKGLEGLLPAGTSVLVAWVEGPRSPEPVEHLSTTGSQMLALSFNPVDGGAVLEAVS
jgi:uncharacterized membrane protein